MNKLQICLDYFVFLIFVFCVLFVNCLLCFVHLFCRSGPPGSFRRINRTGTGAPFLQLINAMSIKSKILILAAFILCLPMITSASTIIRPVMNSGLVGYWNFQEGTGTTAYDKSGKRNHGTLTNMDPTTDWVDGKLGGGLDFDGSDDYIHREIFSSVPSD